jgi:Ribbon-helix-helix protein, copG family
MSKAKNNIRLHIHVDQQLADALRVQSLATGAPIAELIRRAIRLAQFGDAQAKALSSRPAVILTTTKGNA